MVEEPKLGIQQPEALDLPAGAFCKCLHPGEVPRLVPTPNQHMKSDGRWMMGSGCQAGLSQAAMVDTQG